jgi:hypothetical protein
MGRAARAARNAITLLLTVLLSTGGFGQQLPTARADLSEKIRIISGSDINMLARESRLPITVENNWTYPATVTVHGFSNSFRLEVLNRVQVKIPPGESVVAELPVRAIANGQVQVRVWVSVNGNRLGNDTTLTVNVAPDVELFLLIGFVVMLAGLGVAGVVRTRLKLRKNLSVE